MERVERAVSHWHRVYTRLCAAQDSLRRGAAAQPGEPTAAGEDLISQLDRLQDEEGLALRAIDEALSAAKARANGNGQAAAGDPPR